MSNRSVAAHDERRFRPFRRIVVVVAAVALLLPAPRPAAADESSAQVGKYLNQGHVPAGVQATSPPPTGLTINSDGRLVGIPAVPGGYVLNYRGPVECTIHTDPETGQQWPLCTGSAGSRQLLIESGDGTLGSFSVTDGNGQVAAPNTEFAKGLTAVLSDAFGTVAADTEVTFTVSSGAATFPDDLTAVRVRTDDQGVAVSPTLTAGATAGLVTVTVSQPGSTAATFLLTVGDPAPARADLSTVVTAPASVPRGGGMTVSITTTNRGPADATSTFSGIRIPAQFGVASAPGARRHGQLVIWSDGSIAAGASTTRSLTLTVGRNRGTAVIVTAVGSPTPDPKPRNNFSSTTVKVR